MPSMTGPLTLVLAVDPEGFHELAPVMPTHTLRQAQTLQLQSCSNVIIVIDKYCIVYLKSSTRVSLESSNTQKK